MQPLLTVDIEQISISERIQLAEDLWDSILSNPESLAVTELQKQTLDERLERHHTAPEDSSSWQAVKARLGNP